MKIVVGVRPRAPIAFRGERGRRGRPARTTSSYHKVDWPADVDICRAQNLRHTDERQHPASLVGQEACPPNARQDHRGLDLRELDTGSSPA